jgi:hypothetical protein
MDHYLKIEKPYYDAIIAGKKNFEIRYNDRGYQAGDNVVFYIPHTSMKEISATIGYVTAYQQKENFVVFSLLDIKTI